MFACELPKREGVGGTKMPTNPFSPHPSRQSTDSRGTFYDTIQSLGDTVGPLEVADHTKIGAIQALFVEGL